MLKRSLTAVDADDKIIFHGLVSSLSEDPTVNDHVLTDDNTALIKNEVEVHMFEKFNEAVSFAMAAHAGQVRKFTQVPYILHPMEVAAIISTITDEEDVMIAGLLHDTIEDCDVDPDAILDRFGPRVLGLVRSETEEKQPELSASENWTARKRASLDVLSRSTDTGVKILWLADKLSNIRSFHREILKQGDRFWETLHQKDPMMQAWYYRTIGQQLAELAGTAAYQEYMETVTKVFGEGEEK